MNDKTPPLRGATLTREEIKIGKFGSITVYTDPSLPKDTAIIGYPDGKGGMKDGWVKLTNIGETEMTEKWRDTASSESHEDKAKRLGMRFIPKRQPVAEDGVVCGECGMIWKGVMGYVCGNNNCPVQIKIT